MYQDDYLSSNIIIFIVVLAVISIAAQWRIFEKAGKPGWASLIPIYNALVLLEIVGKPWWWLLMFLIPGVNFIFAVWMTNLLAKSFGQGVGFTIGLLLLSIIFYPMLAFGNYEYKGPAGIQHIN
ncbi:MAG: hypothetical protein C0598_00980 [Marinilabiliales bacterium]|nr:MAG: hypothetical protein C0598_00980 [Marinilabiliales bacterium]